jgi:hypothetical protein
MCSVELSTREGDGHIVAAVDGELDLADAAADARRTRRVVVPLRRPGGTHWPHTIVRSGTPSSVAEDGSQQQTREAAASPLPRRRAAESMTVEGGPASESAARNMAKSDPATVVSFPGRRDDR